MAVVRGPVSRDYLASAFSEVTVAFAPNSQDSIEDYSNALDSDPLAVAAVFDRMLTEETS